jgi:hypothetical protein
MLYDFGFDNMKVNKLQAEKSPFFRQFKNFNCWGMVRGMGQRDMRRFSRKEDIQDLQKTDHTVLRQNTEGLLFIIYVCDVAYIRSHKTVSVKDSNSCFMVWKVKCHYQKKIITIKTI